MFPAKVNFTTDKKLHLISVIPLLVPLTINTVFMKTTTTGDIRSMHDLCVCHRALTVLEEHYSAAHLINALVDASLVTLQRNQPEQGNSLIMPQLISVSLSNHLESIESIHAIEAPLPPTNIYTMVVKLHEKLFQQGSFTGC
jgi:hypothetical protein